MAATRSGAGNDAKSSPSTKGSNAKAKTARSVVQRIDPKPAKPAPPKTQEKGKGTQGEQVSPLSDVSPNSTKTAPSGAKGKGKKVQSKPVSRQDPGASKSANSGTLSREDQGMLVQDKLDSVLAHAKPTLPNPQYFQGTDILTSGDASLGSCLLKSPKIRVVSPFKGEGFISIMSGTTGPGSGSICIDKWKKTSFADMDKDVVIPFESVEQIIAVPDAYKDTGPFQIIIILTGATSISPLTRDGVQVMQFVWPNKNATSGLGGVYGENADKGKDTFLSVLKTAIDARLSGHGKEVIIGDGKTDGQFRCYGNLKKITGTPIKEKKTGNLLFLPEGILWLEYRNLYFPFASFDNTMRLVFIRDISRGKRPNGSAPVVAMSIMLDATEPFYKAKGEENRPFLVMFDEVRESILGGCASSLAKIEQYAQKHGLKIEKLQQTFYNYRKNQPMTGFEDVREG